MHNRRIDPPRNQQPHRLPIIAPRSGASANNSESQWGAASLGSTAPESSRSRLPPRSRSGCWTCRTRKVKCDEQRPTCGQCSRLGHECDYNPRLAFRDDTPRVIERMQEVKTEGNSVWDPHSSKPIYTRSSSAEDLLPSFATLTTDEEREKKAESRRPGTYLVVANPESFANLPEYAEDEAPDPTVTPVTASGSVPYYLGGSPERSQIALIVDGADDPNVVILRMFDDNARRASFNIPISTYTSSSMTTSQHSPTKVSEAPSQSLHASDYSPRSKIEEPRFGDRDAQLLQHYRTSIFPLITTKNRADSGEDEFEIQARTFPPLFHAMMALSALSLANKNSIPHAYALEHYQQVIPAMRDTIKSEEDSISDGALLTHYLLMLYEIANSGPWESNMWQQHCDRLLSIATLRRQILGTETRGFMIWMICLIDTYALLSGSGVGAFAETAWKTNMISPTQCIPPVGPGGPQIIFQDEIPHLPAILELNQQVVWLAVQIGQSARDLRAEASRRQEGGGGVLGPEHLYLMNRQSRVRSVQNLCRDFLRSWSARYPQYWPRYVGSQPLPLRAQGYLDHAQSLFQLCVIYAHSSMYPGQLEDRAPEYDTEVPPCATGIIELGRRIVTDEIWGLRCIIFSLFLAGVVSTNPGEKTLAFDLLDHIERRCYGANTAVLKQLLRSIYLRQEESIRNGQEVNIDWMEEMRARDMRLVFFGL